MFNLENVDDIPVFKESSKLYKKIKAICDLFKLYPVIRVYRKDKGEDRGVYFQDTITILWSKPETPTSGYWIFLHEFKHHMMEHNIQLYKEYFMADELLLDITCTKKLYRLSIQKQLALLHDLRPTEIICNVFATEMIGKDYGIAWYQRRKRQFKKQEEKKK